MGMHNFTAFEGFERIASGCIEEIVGIVKAQGIKADSNDFRLYDDETGGAVQIDWEGSAGEVLERLKVHPVLAAALADSPPPPTGPGRPRLGVVSREVSLLPRHWDWLATQPGGASGVLRRLVDEARKRSHEEDEVRRGVEAAHRFMWDMGGNLPDFEEVSRAFFAREFDALPALVSSWPVDVREYLLELVARIPRRS